MRAVLSLSFLFSFFVSCSNKRTQKPVLYYEMVLVMEMVWPKGVAT